MTSALGTWPLLTATAGLLAFLIGVYTLAGRDRKSPYLINSVFAVFLICLLGAALDVAALIAEPLSPRVSRWLLVAGTAVLLLAILVTMWRLWTIYVRFAYFVDPGGAGRLKLLPGLRQYKAWKKRNEGPNYEDDPVPLGEDLQQSIRKIILDAAGLPLTPDRHQGKLFDDPASENIKAEVRDHQDPRSLAMALRHQGQANDLLGDLCIAFLREPNHYVQYMTASRHPIEFVDYLQAAVNAEKLTWTVLRNRIVVVDAYTPHFGFLDTTNGDKTRRLRKEFGSRLLSSTETYAGLHSAASAAFKSIKRASGAGSMRQPTLVIYEDMYALSDVESIEQYRIFARHVIPSERLWGGMFTVFAETAQTEEDWKLISSYAGMTLDLREMSGSRLHPERLK